MLKIFAYSLSILLMLTSCSGDGLFGGKPKHPGKRVAIISSEVQKPAKNNIVVSVGAPKSVGEWRLSNSFQRADLPNNILYSGSFVEDGSISISDFSKGYMSSVSSLAVSKKGKIYLLNNSIVHCFDLVSKEELWQHKLEHKKGVGGGIYVTDDIVYVTNGGIQILALNSSDGSQLWSFQSQNLVTYPPIYYNGVVYAVASDNTIFALEGKKGKLIWQEGGHYQTTVSAASGVNLVVEKNIVAVSEAGGEIVVYNNQDGSMISTISPDSTEEFVSTASVGVFQPLLIKGNNLFVLNEKSVLTSINLMTGAEENKIKTISGKYFWVTDRFIFVVSEHNNLYCYQLSNSELVWQTGFTLDKGSFVISSMIVNSKLYIFANTGEVKIFNPLNGELVESHNVGEISMEPIFVKDKLITVSANGKIMFWK